MIDLKSESDLFMGTMTAVIRRHARRWRYPLSEGCLWAPEPAVQDLHKGVICSRRTPKGVIINVHGVGPGRLSTKDMENKNAISSSA